MSLCRLLRRSMPCLPARFTARFAKGAFCMALDFLILYEHTVREYESDLLLKLELERRGYLAE